MLDERVMVAGERIHVMAADPVAQKSDRPGHTILCRRVVAGYCPQLAGSGLSVEITMLPFSSRAGSSAIRPCGPLVARQVL